MSLTVKHLNDDSTFLLTFSPLEVPSRHGSHQLQPPPGTFSILVDPWITGPSLMWHSKFLLSRHTVPPCIQHLSHIPPPNVVLVSQDKPDHCHETTLRQLDANSRLTTILAEPAAAKKIRAMKHFNPSQIHALPVYSERKPESVVRFLVPPLSPAGTPGEVTMAFIPAKLDVSGLHNAVGITYRPPTAAYIPPASHLFTPPLSISSLQQTLDHSKFSQNLPPTPPDSPNLLLRSTTTTTTTTTASTVPSTPPASHPSPSLSISSTSSSTFSPPVSAKTLSVIYSPHGAPLPLILNYATYHLVPLAALPLTALLHSLDRVQNPWWLGGNINAGVPGGVEIARALMARCWIGAHDEEKENSGVSVMKVVTRKFSREEVRGLVGRETQVEVLGVGEELALRT